MSIKPLYAFLLLLLLSLSSASFSEAPLPVTESTQFGAKRLDFDLGEHKAFLILPDTAPQAAHPWVWYAPTFIGGNPDPSHTWYFKKLLTAGFYIGGIEVGESFGNPAGRAAYQRYYEYITTHYPLSKKACLLPQSRGGLMLYNWAVEHPDAVQCIAGIYTVCSFLSYPGLDRAAPAYGMSPEALRDAVKDQNPVERLAPLAQAGVPIYHVHGDSDTVVPLKDNAGDLITRYKALGGTATLKVIAGKGHEVCKEFFQDQGLLDFLLNQGRAYRVVDGPENDAKAIQTYYVESPYLDGPCRVRIAYPKEKTNRILFVLPVAPWPGFEDKWDKHGDGLNEILKLNLHNQFGYTVVAPDFPHYMPWYVDHVSDLERRHESYMIHALIPFVDALLEIKNPIRDLIGFSKSGYGALRLLLEHPDTFHACAIWDPGAITQPYTADNPNSLSDAAGMENHFNTLRIEQSIQANKPHFQITPRIAIAGYSNEKFQNNLNVLHEMLTKATIPHHYDNTQHFDHHWFTGWLKDSVTALDSMREQ